jgi:hypothetical protein
VLSREGKGFQGVFSATIKTAGPRLSSLAAGVVLWAIGGVAIREAFILTFSPLSGLEVSWSDMNWSDVAGLNWYGVNWVLVVIYVLGALLGFWLGSLAMRRWRRLRKLPEGIVGNGIRVLPDGSVELGMIGIRPASLKGVLATGRGPIKSVRWKRRARFSGEREILINILRTAERGLMVGHMILKVGGGHEAMFLEFYNAEIDNQSTLWVASESEIIWLDRAIAEAQLETVSNRLAPIARRSGGLLTLTVTECAADAGKSGCEGAAHGAGGEAAGQMLVSATDSLQARADELLARHVLPSSFFNLAGILAKYGYKLRPNVDAERFRGR